MRQLLDLSAVSLQGRDGGICKVSAQCFVDRLTSVTGLAGFIPGILQTICASLTQVIFGHSIDLGALGKFQLSISETLFLQMYF